MSRLCAVRASAIAGAMMLAVCASGSIGVGAARADQGSVSSSLPHLAKNGKAWQLMVAGRPYTVVGGELQNSDSSTVGEIDRNFRRLGRGRGLNTIGVPVSWAQLEPSPGHFNFRLVDEAIRQARRYHKHIIIDWFGSYKNSDSTYAPGWVLRDEDRYPLSQVHLPGGKLGKVDVLTPFSSANRDADATAFAAMMGRVKALDALRSTVVMVQVENEVGLLSPFPPKVSRLVSSRDYSPQATAAFGQQVPASLTAYLAAHRSTLEPTVATDWSAHGNRMAGTWTQVFGNGPIGDEIFMASGYAQYVDAVAAAGARQLDIPMFVNTWIVQPSSSAPGGPTPGDYPSGGAVAQMHDVWRAEAPQISILAPDIHLPQAARIYREYEQAHGQTAYPGFSSESATGETGAMNAFDAIGQGAVGYIGFGIEEWPTDTVLKAAYGCLDDLSGFIAAQMPSGGVQSVWLDPSAGTRRTQTFSLDGYTLTAHLSDETGDSKGLGYAIVIATGPGKFVLAGDNVYVTFKSAQGTPALATDDLGTYRGGANANGGDLTGARWVTWSVLNGDETSGGYYFGLQALRRMSPNAVKLAHDQIQKISLYTY